MANLLRNQFLFAEIIFASCRHTFKADQNSVRTTMLLFRPCIPHGFSLNPLTVDILQSYNTKNSVEYVILIQGLLASRTNVAKLSVQLLRHIFDEGHLIYSLSPAIEIHRLPVKLL